MNKHTVMLLSDDLMSNCLRLTNWLDDFTEKHNLELVTIDNNLAVFRPVKQQAHKPNEQKE